MVEKIKYTKSFLARLENLIAESDYILRYEKGHFKSGYCLLREQKIILISKFYTTEGKIDTLLDILRIVPLDTHRFAEDTKKIHAMLVATEKKDAILLNR